MGGASSERQSKISRLKRRISLRSAASLYSELVAASDPIIRPRLLGPLYENFKSGRTGDSIKETIFGLSDRAKLLLSLPKSVALKAFANDPINVTFSETGGRANKDFLDFPRGYHPI